MIQRRLRNSGFAPSQSAPSVRFSSSPLFFERSVSLAPKRSSLMPAHSWIVSPAALMEIGLSQLTGCHAEFPSNWTSAAYWSMPTTNLLRRAERTSNASFAPVGAFHCSS